MRGQARLVCGSIAALFAILLATPAEAQEPEFTGDLPYETTEVADGIYRFRHMFHNNLFVVTSEGVVAFDPLSQEAAGHYGSEIQRVAPGKELLALIYSHDHADHVSGGPTLFAALGDAPIIAHENAYAKLAAAQDAARPVPDITLTDKAVLRFGGRTIELHYVGKTHSDNMLVAYIPDSRLAFAVDFVSHDAVGYQTLPDWHYPELYEAIERLLEIPFETIVFGHGPAGDRSSVERQLQYYRSRAGGARSVSGLATVRRVVLDERR